MPGGAEGKRAVMRPPRRLLVTTFGLMTVVVAGVITLIVVPPFDDPGWLVPATFAAAAFVACAIGVKIQKSRRGGPSGIRPAPRLWLILVSLAIVFVVAIVTVFAGQDLGAAASLGAHPAQTTVARILPSTCGGCGQQTVEYSTADGPMTAQLTGTSTVAVGDRLVYDRASPGRVMPYGDWSYGRSKARWTLLVLLVVCIGWVGLLIALSRGRRRRQDTLHPGIPISAVRLRSGNVWRVGFADGKHAAYLDTPELRAAVRARLAADGSLATVGEKERALLDGHHGRGSIGLP